MNFNFYTNLEEEGEMFQVKKSSYSRKIHKERKKHKSNEKSLSKNSTSNESYSNYGSSKDLSPPPTAPTTAKESNYIKEIQSDDGFSVRLLLFNFIKHPNIKNLESIITIDFFYIAQNYIKLFYMTLKIYYN